MLLLMGCLVSVWAKAQAQAQSCDSTVTNLNKLGDTIEIGNVNPDGLKCGHWKRFYDSGQLSSSGNYDHGKMVGHWKGYYEGGALKFSETYIKLRPLTKDSIFEVGRHVGYSQSEEDSKIGQSVLYDQDGRIMKLSNFDSNGVPINEIVFSKSGIVNEYKVFDSTQMLWHHYEGSRLVEDVYIDHFITKNPVKKVFYKEGQKVKMMEYQKDKIVTTRFREPR